jgi:hypothetical protein
MLLEDFPGVLAMRLQPSRKRPRKHLTYEFVNEEMAAAMERSQVHEEIVVPEARQGEERAPCMYEHVSFLFINFDAHTHTKHLPICLSGSVIRPFSDLEVANFAEQEVIQAVADEDVMHLDDELGVAPAQLLHQNTHDDGGWGGWSMDGIGAEQSFFSDMDLA